MPSPFTTPPLAPNAVATPRCRFACVFIVGLVESCVDPDLDVSLLVVLARMASLLHSVNKASFTFPGRSLFLAGFGAENDGMRVGCAESIGCENERLGDPGGDVGGEKSVILYPSAILSTMAPRLSYGFNVCVSTVALDGSDCVALW